MKVRFAAVAAALVALGAALLPAAPASAIESIAPIGSIDTISVRYVGTDPTPTIHLTGWAADRNDWGANGHTTAGIEFTAAAPGGARVGIGWAENGDFAYPRPDAAKVYGVGPYQGFDAWAGGHLPATGTLNVCARLYNINAAPVYTATLTCVNIVVPSSRPAIASLSGSDVAGSTLTASMGGPSGGTDSYAWTTWNPSGPNPSAYPSPLAGATGTTYTTRLDDIGRQIRATVTSKLPSTTIEQITDPVEVTFPLPGGVSQVASSDRFATSVAASKTAYPDSAAGVPVAYVASGIAFPDALSAGAAAVKKHGTLLLTMPGALDPNVAAELVRLHPPQVIVVGGPNAIADSVLDAIRALPFAPQVRRIGGADRFEVSRAIIDDAWGGAVPDLYLVTGNAFPDALAAAAAAAQTGRPVLLVNGWLARPDAATSSAIGRWGTTHVTVVGGPDVVTGGLAGGLGIPYDRVQGSDRFGTATELARALPHTGVVYFASGLNFPDALSTAILAGARNGALLLARGGCTPVVDFAAMRDTGVTTAVAVGGYSVLAPGFTGQAC